MPVRHLAILGILNFLVLLVAFVGSWLGSEYYFFLPSRRSGLQPPPSHPAIVLILVAIPSIVFWFSRRHAAVIYSVTAFLCLLGPLGGNFFFNWTPGIAQFLLIAAMGSVAVFVWSKDSLSED